MGDERACWLLLLSVLGCQGLAGASECCTRQLVRVAIQRPGLKKSKHSALGLTFQLITSALLTQ